TRPQPPTLRAHTPAFASRTRSRNSAAVRAGAAERVQVCAGTPIWVRRLSERPGCGVGQRRVSEEGLALSVLAGHYYGSAPGALGGRGGGGGTRRGARVGSS